MTSSACIRAGHRPRRFARDRHQERRHAHGRPARRQPIRRHAAGDRPTRPGFDSLAPETLFYVEPHGQYGVTVQSDFPAWQWDTVRYVRTQAPDVSVHGEVFSPFSQSMELPGCETTLNILELARAAGDAA
jgi:hypothetical protein